ncbi:hypothetical protein NEF87_002278 [Candidatus Lokiarchaeum ossiferum]|uniref:Polymerase nucleotidyl transferase domain-containing protein n=1 Tax=Candidatus Lokiarchaeum ossiferum TaxID=2951803 RepID=A0ABY6HRL6_9ARCH|nr:hypothetical protein NEF87_002278 [Candidatus Lokiarchaeum sp. B-35]
MPRMKVKQHEESQIIYTPDHWDLLNSIRSRAIEVTQAFARHGFDTLTYGSIARGDVKPTSDIDIILTTLIPSYRVELILDEIPFPLISKKLIQATPNDVIKAHFELEGEICLTLLLTDFTSMPFEFYKFGGALSFNQLQDNIRVPGVDKRLVLIQPTETGHVERSIENNAHLIAKVVGVSASMVSQRMRVLTRRDKVGRTGVFLNHSLALSENIEETLRNLARKNPMIRRRLNR